MASIQDVAELAFSIAGGGCPKILEQLLCFLGRSPAVDQAAVFLVVVIPLAYVAGVFVSHFAGVVLAHLHPAAAAPAPLRASATGLSFADLWRFIVMLFTLVSAWLLAIGFLLAFFYVVVIGKRGILPGFSWNVRS